LSQLEKYFIDFCLSSFVQLHQKPVEKLIVNHRKVSGFTWMADKFKDYCKSVGRNPMRRLWDFSTMSMEIKLYIWKPGKSVPSH
jgi:hypothetical protein